MDTRIRGIVPTTARLRRALEAVAPFAAVALLAMLPSLALADAAESPDSSAQVAAAMDPGTTPAPTVQPIIWPLQGSRAPSDAIDLQHFRSHDIRGLNVFEAPKQDNVPYKGKQLVWGFAFTQQFQGLNHSTVAQPKLVTVGTSTVNANELMPIGYGFNNASANLYLDAQIARGIRVALTGYLSSRHHQETWVKDGYLLIDDSPIDNAMLKDLMHVLSLRVGHFEINYGDAHFRRSDNGNAFFNPFVGNLLMDAFTTEIGAEAYLQGGGFLAMAGTTGGEVRGQVQKPNDRSPSYLAKLGYDRQLSPDLRVRLTSSFYANRKSISNTLYTGSRAGSRYYSVLENTQSTETAQAWSGDVQPGFKNKIAAVVVNPFIKYRGLELFGNLEQAKGRAFTETTQRIWTQYAGEALYRFASDQLYVGGRFNTASGNLAGIAGDLTVERTQAGGGWFVTPNLLMKGEYVRQAYVHFPANDIRSGAKFHGFMVEGVVVF